MLINHFPNQHFCGWYTYIYIHINLNVTIYIYTYTLIYVYYIYIHMVVLIIPKWQVYGIGYTKTLAIFRDNNPYDL